jgi:glycogen debranching enzyme
VEQPSYLPYVALRDCADRFDALGNLLALLFKVAGRTKAEKIRDYVRGCGLNQPFLVRALYPPVRPGEKDWREYCRVRNLNQSHNYHNGGAWLFIGGFYVAALARAGRLEEACRQLAKLAEMNRLDTHGEWGFNWLSGRPIGYDCQSWSAAPYLFAYECVERK